MDKALDIPIRPMIAEKREYVSQFEPKQVLSPALSCWSKFIKFFFFFFKVKLSTGLGISGDRPTDQDVFLETIVANQLAV